MIYIYKLYRSLYTYHIYQYQHVSTLKLMMLINRTHVGWLEAKAEPATPETCSE